MRAVFVFGQIRFNARQVLLDLGVGVDISPQSFSGSVETTNGEAIVRVNSRDTAIRQRFALAHELGHLLLHVDPSVSGVHFRDTNYLGNTRQEREANAFASEILMPKVWISELRKIGHNAESMAEIFGVSVDAVRTRTGYMISKGRL